MNRNALIETIAEKIVYGDKLDDLGFQKRDAFEIFKEANSHFFSKSSTPKSLEKVFQKLIKGLDEATHDLPPDQRDKELQHIKSSMFANFRGFLNENLETLFYFSVLMSLVSEDVFLIAHPDFTAETLADENLSDKGKLRTELIKLLYPLFPDYISRRHSHLDWKQSLTLLATYNRFVIVLKNARADSQEMKKRKVGAIKIKNTIFEKYRIKSLPRNKDLTSPVKSLAVSLAQQSLKLNLSEKRLKEIIRKTQRLYEADRGVKLKTVLIDVSFPGDAIRFFTVEPSSEKAKTLTLAPLDKSNKDIYYSFLGGGYL